MDSPRKNLPVLTSQEELEEQVRQRTAELSRALQLQQDAQQALVRSADQLSEAQRLAHIGSWELELLTNRLHWSDEIFRLFEIDQAKFGATYEAFLNAIHPEDRDAVNQAYSQSLADQQPYEITHRLQMPDGRIKWVHERCTSTFDAQGKPLRSVGTVQDITEQHQAEQALAQLNQELEQRVARRTAEVEAARNEAEHASRAKSEFLSRMSHELRTPLNAILGFGQLLVADDAHPLAPEQRENVQEMLQAGRHLLDLVNEMLDLTRVESGHIDLSLEPVEIAPLLQACLAQVRPLAQQRQLTLEAAAAPCVLQADRLRLRQVLLNLLSNAIKYNRTGGRVQVSCQPVAGERIRIEVRDSGQGIAPENLARLFRPFERLESAYKGIEGAGIGLALTRRLVEGMGGEVGVSSVPGEGSTFWVVLPAAPVPWHPDTERMKK
jgi:signal transduction histidine kinase